MYLDGEILKIKKGHHLVGEKRQPGERVECDGLPAVCTKDGWLVLDEVQPAGKKSMTGDVFLRGARHWK
jgi:methionyl-tRNA formyltransferase